MVVKSRYMPNANVVQLFQILKDSARPDRFPFFCAVLIGGSTLFPLVLRRASRVLAGFSRRHGQFATNRLDASLGRFFGTFVVAWLSFRLLNTRFSWETLWRSPVSTIIRPRSDEQKRDVATAEQHLLAGRTMDLTLFSLTRALDTCIGTAWRHWKTRRQSANRWTLAEAAVSRLTDAGIFAASASIVMWAWVYVPERLPRSYNQWITQAAQIDIRLVEALREARRGNWEYGRDSDCNRILEDVCRDHGMPPEWGNPAKSIPIPCQVVHLGSGSSCEGHGISRFAKAFRFALVMYLPLNLAVRLRSLSALAVLRSLADAVRSSAFLGAFVSLFYYSVCLARTRLGPKLFSYQTITPMMWDSGLCVAAGCMMCGWSILLEKAQRQSEIALFVAPRALAAWLPRRYDKKVSNDSK